MEPAPILYFRISLRVWVSFNRSMLSTPSPPVESRYTAGVWEVLPLTPGLIDFYTNVLGENKLSSVKETYFGHPCSTYCYTAFFL